MIRDFNWIAADVDCKRLFYLAKWVAMGADDLMKRALVCRGCSGRSDVFFSHFPIVYIGEMNRLR